MVQDELAKLLGAGWSGPLGQALPVPLASASRPTRSQPPPRAVRFAFTRQPTIDSNPNPARQLSSVGHVKTAFKRPSGSFFVCMTLVSGC